MQMVHVVNDNKYPFSQVFKGRKIEIPAGKYIEMDDAEAEEFLGLFSPIKKDANDQPDPRSYKMLRKVKKVFTKPAEDALGYKCNACGKDCTSDADLKKHVESEHSGEQFVDPEIEEQIKHTKKPKGKKDDN